MPGVPGTMLLLDHVGAKSGKRRTSPLLYFRDGENVVIVASKGGYPKNPAWFHNLMANPDTTAQIGRERRAVHARVATPEERERLWPEAVRCTAATRTTRPAAKGGRSRWSSSSRASDDWGALVGLYPTKAPRHFGRRSSATGSPPSPAIASGGQGPAQLSRAPSIVIVVPEKKSPAGEAR